jgi:branched-chain amino acid transport system permease protein
LETRAWKAQTVTISSEYNILAVGVVLIAFVALAPDGLLGLRSLRKGANARNE